MYKEQYQQNIKIVLAADKRFFHIVYFNISIILCVLKLTGLFFSHLNSRQILGLSLNIYIVNN